MLAIMKKEIRSYFYSPIAYVLIGAFVFIMSIYFMSMVSYQVGEASELLSFSSYILIFIIPILTMRLLTEDRKNGTESLLLTSPTSLTAIVVGKYLASLFVFAVMIALSFVYPIIQVAFGGEFTSQVACGYIGFFLLGASFISFGLFTSSLTENQIIAAVIGIAGFLVIWISDAVSSIVGGIVGQALSWFSLLSRYQTFANGVLGLSQLVYFLSFIALFLFLTIRVIERRRWSQS